MPRNMYPRILTPEGEILKILLKQASTAPQLVDKADLGRTTVYSNLKDLLIMKWIKENNGIYRATDEGVKIYWSSVLPENDVDRLVKVSGYLGITTAKLVHLGIRLITDLIEGKRIPDDLGDFLRVRDRELLAELYRIIKGRKVTATEREPALSRSRPRT